ncbi:LytR family transcriptional regulator [Solihabitans fulvus]|uniref:LytR family transcriptional regulator n=1 Tax=Solihabitans fulvus TaxID=1892852 RepID=A0A5B2XE00_9PSEU|nr:LytR family transcriptional regulator [Solihabitans fulvus]
MLVTARPPRRTVNRVAFAAARSVVALLSAAVLAVTWWGWAKVRTINEGTVTIDVIESTVNKDARKPLDGAVDILLVGLDSRTDAQGKPLSPEVLDLLNAGVADGEQNTDTMILVHIPVDGTRAVAFSFPRDSYVDIADGFGKHKLNSAFARQRNTIAADLARQGVTDQNRINQEAALAGRKTLIKTIEQLTGGAITIDRYAEVNLASFYEISKAIGGVQVCLKEATSDDKSGADFKKGLQTVEGAQALAFVRQRYNLPGGDLDRITRQQVFMGALAKQVLSTGTLTDSDKLDKLVTAVKKSVVLSQGWDITTFAEQMQGLVSGNIQFRTIPVGEPTDTYGDGNVLPVDPKQVKAFVSGLATDSQPTSSASSSAPSASSSASGPHLTTSPSAPPPTDVQRMAGQPSTQHGGTSTPPTSTSQLITADGIPCVN